MTVTLQRTFLDLVKLSILPLYKACYLFYLIHWLFLYLTGLMV